MKQTALHPNVTPWVMLVSRGVIAVLIVLIASSLFFQNTYLNAETHKQASAPKAVELNGNSTLSDYLTYAALHNAGLKAAFHRWQAALARIPFVRSLPDPRFNFTYFIREIETRVGPQRQKVGVMQMFPWFDKLKLRGNAAFRVAQVEKHRYDALKLNLFYRVKDAYYEYYFALRKIALIEENVQLLQRQDEVLQAKYRTGKAPFTALIKLQVEIDKLRERVRSEESGLRPIKARLNAALNRPLQTPLNQPGELPAADPAFSPERLSELLRETNPALKALESSIEKEKVDLKLAKRSYYPDFSLGIDYMITAESNMPGIPNSGKDPIAVMASVHLPIWFSKNRAAVKAAEQHYLAAQSQKQEEENKLLTRLETVIAGFRDAERKMTLYKDSLLPKGKQALNVMRTAFETGSADFLDFIDSQRTLLNFELEYERARTDYARRLAELEMMVSHLPPAALPGAKPKRITNIEHRISNVEGVLKIPYYLQTSHRLPAPRG